MLIKQLLKKRKYLPEGIEDTVQAVVTQIVDG